MPKLGLIAGGGGLPAAIAAACLAEGRPLFVVRLKGLADAALQAYPGEDIGLAELGRSLRALRRAGCDRVCLAGQVRRPDFAALRPDFTGLKYLPRLATAAHAGDDALLRAVLRVFEDEGFGVEGVGVAGASLLLEPGPLGRIDCGDEDRADLKLALQAALELGRADIGQAAVARAGRVTTEDAEGTDALLARCSAAGAPLGVLVKAPKPGQDLRVDLPTIGPATVEGAARAGLRGVAGPAGGLLVVDRSAVAAAADRLGLFVVGLPGAPP